MNIYIRIAATQCSLGTWFFSGICVGNLRKENTEDNNNNNNNNNNNLRSKVLTKASDIFVSFVV